LGKNTFSRIGAIVSFVAYASLTALHDVLLLSGVHEKTTLTCSTLATILLGAATNFVSFWAMGVLEVFVAPAVDNDLRTCACYYYIPEITALIALSTPLAAFLNFNSKVQEQGLAALFGDFLIFQTYYIPHYLGKQSTHWTWSILCSPKMAGTIEGDPRKDFSMEDRRLNPEGTIELWKHLRRLQTAMYYMKGAVQVIVGLTSSVIMIGFKGLLVKWYLEPDSRPAVRFFLKWVAFPLPSIIAIGSGAVALHDLFHGTVKIDAGETFGGQLLIMFPFLKECCPNGVAGYRFGEETDDSQPRSQFDQQLGNVFFAIGLAVIVLLTWSVADGLAPELNFMLGRESLKYPKLAEAEMWGSAGFIFWIVHVPRLMALAFSNWDDMESLKFLSMPKHLARHSSASFYHIPTRTKEHRDIAYKPLDMELTTKENSGNIDSRSIY